MSFSDKPTFFLLPSSDVCPADRGPLMLGALCDSMENPCSSWKPHDASKVLSAYFQANHKSPKPIQVFLESPRHALSRTKSHQARADLEDILQVAWERSRSDAYNIDAQWIRTVRLPQQLDVFNAIAEHPEVKQFRKERKHKRYFMITGYKSCLNGVVDGSSGTSSTPEGDLNVPMEQILDAAGAPLHPGILPSMGVSGTWTTAWEDLSRCSLRGEYIIAVEYREVLKRSWLAAILDNRKKSKLADSYCRHRTGSVAFEGTHAGDDGICESENDSGDDIPELHEYLKQSWTIETDGDDAYILGMKVDKNTDRLATFLG
jgi:hypothetical protein